MKVAPASPGRLALALALGMPMLASAQAGPQVSLYGVIDAYVGRAHAGDTTQYRVEDGGHSASRLGFRGSEDLGGGLRASMLMEGGFLPDTGAGTIPGPGFAWTRQVSVGLAGAWGSLELGRMYTPLFFSLFRHDPFGYNAVFSPMTLASSSDAQTGITPFAVRNNNMVRWKTPATSPLAVDLSYAFGEASQGRSGDVYGGAIGWREGGLSVGYGFQRARSGTAAAPVPAPDTSTVQALSASYQLGPVKAFGNYIRADSTLATVEPAQLWMVGVSYEVTGTTRLIGSLLNRQVRDSPRKQTAAALGVDHALSVRTIVYARASFLDNRGGSQATLSQVALPGNVSTDTNLVAIGIRHAF
ncbi:MAG: porin [Rhizobacter sp.]|nr:porin [Rhizobacter sp.]